MKQPEPTAQPETSSVSRGLEHALLGALLLGGSVVLLTELGWQLLTNCPSSLPAAPRNSAPEAKS